MSQNNTHYCPFISKPKNFEECSVDCALALVVPGAEYDSWVCGLTASNTVRRDTGEDFSAQFVESES